VLPPNKPKKSHMNSNEKNEMKSVSLSGACNEWGAIEKIALRSVEAAFESEDRIERDWQALRFHAKPDFEIAKSEYQEFKNLVCSNGAEAILLGPNEALTLDSIYPRDAVVLSPQGLILCRMGRVSRGKEPQLNSERLKIEGYSVLGTIQSPGTLEGGDFIWLDEHHAAVGLGPRTNEVGIAQLKALLGEQVDLHVVPLPPPEHPEDVFHLMSMISPLDKDLALIYRPLMPEAFLSWLESLGIRFVEVSEAEFIPMGCNVLAIGPRQVIMLADLPETKQRLQKADCKVLAYKGDEISRKGEGGPTCLTRPLVRSR
jgi:N-dimethylarginine dimethylaminohydrolase